MPNPYASEVLDPTDFEVAVLKRLDRIADILEAVARPQRVVLNQEAPWPKMPQVVRGPMSTDIL